MLDYTKGNSWSFFEAAAHHAVSHWMWSLKADVCQAASMAPTPQNGFFVSWEQVMAFFAMAEEALKAKSAANEVHSQIRAPSGASVARSGCGCTIGCLPALQVLRRDGEGVKEELEEKRSAYIKVMLDFCQHAAYLPSLIVVAAVTRVSRAQTSAASAVCHVLMTPKQHRTCSCSLYTLPRC